MKRYSYILLIFTIGVVGFASSCSKDEVKEQTDNATFYPRIFNDVYLFPEYRDSVYIMKAGDTLAFRGLQFSPGDKVQVAWSVNDTPAGDGKEYFFVPQEGGDFRIKVEASYDGMSTSRYRDVFVIPSSFTPKPYNHVVMAYASDTAQYKYLDFSKMTHLAYKVATVTAAGTMDVSKGEIYKKSDVLIGKAHVNGVPVLLGISGTLSGDGWSVYASSNFGNALVDIAKRTALVAAIKEYVTAKKMDGVEILMTDINNTTGAQTNANIQAAGLFLNELRASLGADAIITITVPGIQYAGSYPDLSAANWINVHAYEDGLHVGPGKPLGQPSGYDYFVDCAETWMAKYPKNKLVIGIPAFGLRYTALDGNGNNLGWTSYNYMPYKQILAADATASGKEYAEIAEGVYFNGIPLVTEKSNYLKEQGYLGAYIWAGEYDVTTEQSLTATIHNILQ